MIPTSNGPDAVNFSGYQHPNELYLQGELLPEDVFAGDRNTRQGDFMEPSQLLAVSLADPEAQRLFPELFGTKQLTQGDTKNVFYGYEINRSEITRSVFFDGSEELSITHTVHRSIVRWQEAVTDCDCCLWDEDFSSQPDTSTATCGFLRRQQAISHPITGDVAHCLAERPVGDLLEIGDGERGSLNCDLGKCCEIRKGVVDNGQWPSLNFTKNDTQFPGDLETSCGHEVNYDSDEFQKALHDFLNEEIL